MIKYILLVVFVAVISFALVTMTRLGAFKDVRLTEIEEGPFKQLYKEHVGATYKIVPVIESVEKWAKENHLKCPLSFGEYVENPRDIPEDRLKSLGGCLVDQDLSKQKLPEGFLYREQGRRLYVVATFDGAPSIAPYKVYPKVLDQIRERKQSLDGPVTEIYRVTPDGGVETKYLFPVKAL